MMTRPEPIPLEFDDERLTKLRQRWAAASHAELVQEIEQLAITLDMRETTLKERMRGGQYDPQA
ncbi:MAG: hypothetical protein ABSF15_25205 [Candidatus Sulfotelmatobacter sp.]|jgi:hypothetical protein